MMEVVGSSMVVTVDLRPGIRVAAAWSGGPLITIHAVANGGFGMAVETLDVWDRWLDRPRIEQTLEALERYVVERLRELDDETDFGALVEDVVDWEERRSGELVTASLN
jgi:hypothetical protein